MSSKKRRRFGNKQSSQSKKRTMQTEALKCPITGKAIWAVQPNDEIKHLISDSHLSSHANSAPEIHLLINLSSKEQQTLKAANSVTSDNAKREKSIQKLLRAMNVIINPELDIYDLTEDPDDNTILGFLDGFDDGKPTSMIVTKAQLEEFKETLQSTKPGRYKSQEIQLLENALKAHDYDFHSFLLTAPDARRYALGIKSLIKYLDLEPQAFAEVTLGIEGVYTLYTNAKKHNKAAMLRDFLHHNEIMKEKYAHLLSAAEDIYRQEEINLKKSPEQRDIARLTITFEKAEANIALATQLTEKEKLALQLSAYLKQIEALQKELEALKAGQAQLQKTHDQKETNTKLKFETKISELEEKIKTLTSEINGFLQKEAQQNTEINRLKDANHRLEDQHTAIEEELNTLRRELATNKRQLSAARSQSRELPNSSEGYPQIVTAPSELFPPIALVKDWADATLQGKLIIHPRAARAAQQSLYQNPADVFKALMLLGNDYRTMKLDGSLRIQQELKDALRVLGMDSVRSIAPQEMGKYADQYTIKQGSKNLSLDWHIRKGRAQNPLTTMRIYFPSELDNDQVVVGHLTSHLDNRLS